MASSSPELSTGEGLSTDARSNRDGAESPAARTAAGLDHAAAVDVALGKVRGGADLLGEAGRPSVEVTGGGGRRWPPSGSVLSARAGADRRRGEPG